MKSLAAKRWGKRDENYRVISSENSVNGSAVNQSISEQSSAVIAETHSSNHLSSSSTDTPPNESRRRSSTSSRSALQEMPVNATHSQTSPSASLIVDSSSKNLSSSSSSTGESPSQAIPLITSASTVSIIVNPYLDQAIVAEKAKLDQLHATFVSYSAEHAALGVKINEYATQNARLRIELSSLSYNLKLLNKT